jgi:hypothetical protein
MTDRRDAGEPEPIAGLEVLTPRVRIVLGALAVLAVAALLATALVPRSLDAGQTLLATEYTVSVAPRFLAPSFTVTADDRYAVVRGDTWPAQLQVAQVRLGPDAVAAVGSVPRGTDSVRLTTDLGTVHESRVRTVAWHRVHATVVQGPVEVVEAVAIGTDGQVLAVADDLPAPRELSPLVR